MFILRTRPVTHHNIKHVLGHCVGVDLAVVITILRCVVAGEPADGIAALSTPPSIVGLLQDEDSCALGQRKFIGLLGLIVILDHSRSDGLCGIWGSRRDMVGLSTCREGEQLGSVFDPEPFFTFFLMLHRNRKSKYSRSVLG